MKYEIEFEASFNGGVTVEASSEEEAETIAKDKVARDNFITLTDFNPYFIQEYEE